jgi:hypothetical protein
MAPESKILKIFSYTDKYMNSFPYSGPNQPPGGHDFSKLAFVLCQKAFM